MRHITFKLLLLTASFAMLAGCSSNEPVSRGTYEPDDPAEEPVVTQAPEPSTDPVTPEPEPVVYPGLFGNEFAENEVEGNGGYFVKVGRKVYYRVISPEGMPDSALFGEYLQYEDSSDASTLAVYDLDTGTYSDVMEANGYGNMFACTDGILLSDGNGNIILYDTEAKTNSLYCSGDTIIDVSDDGRQVAVSEHDEDWNISYSVYIDGKLIHTVYGVTDAYGFAGSNLITMRHEDDDSYRMISYSIAGYETTLGSFTKPDDVYDAWTYPECIEFETVGDTAYITYGYYEGTGHFLSVWEAYKMQAGEENSLEGDISTADNNMVSWDETPKMFVDPDGEIFFYGVKKNTLGLSDGYYGDLVYYDSPFSAEILRKYFLAGYMDQEWYDNILASAVFDRTAFLITARGCHIREEDIGWRYSYAPTEYEYMVIPFGDGVERDAEGIPENYEYLAMEFPKHASVEDAEELMGTVWLCYSYHAEGDAVLAEDDNYDRTLNFLSDGTLKLDVTDKSSKKVSTYILEPEELSYYPEFACYGLDDENGHEDWVLFRHIGDHLEFSVEWLYGDGTPGGCDYVFNPLN